MAPDIDLNKYNVDSLNFDSEYANVTGTHMTFPKYTRSLINSANQDSQGTRPIVIGQLSELIKQCPNKDYASWREWYLQMHPNSIDYTTEKIKDMIDNYRDAIDLIDDDMIRDWAEDLILAKTVDGFIIQEIVLKYLSQIRNVNWRFATADEISANVSGFIGNTPISIKSITYLTTPPAMPQTTGTEVVYYKKTGRFLKIVYEKNTS